MAGVHLPSDTLNDCLKRKESAWIALRVWLVDLFSRVGRSVFDLSDAECDDAVQQTLAELLQNDCRTLRAFRGGCRPETYLTAVARRVAVDVRWARPKALSLDCIEPSASVDEPDLRRIDFWEAASRCLPSSDLLLLRFYAAGLSLAEIAAVLAQTRGEQVTADALAVRKHRALTRVREKLAH